MDSSATPSRETTPLSQPLTDIRDLPEGVVRVKPMTSRQIARAWKARRDDAPRYTEEQLRKMDREAELMDRAKRLEEKANRAAVNKQKRLLKEAKERERLEKERIALGGRDPNLVRREERWGEDMFSPSQAMLSKFFGGNNTTKKSIGKENDEPMDTAPKSPCPVGKENRPVGNMNGSNIATLKETPLGFAKIKGSMRTVSEQKRLLPSDDYKEPIVPVVPSIEAETTTKSEDRITDPGQAPLVPKPDVTFQKWTYKSRKRKATGAKKPKPVAPAKKTKTVASNKMDTQLSTSPAIEQCDLTTIPKREASPAPSETSRFESRPESVRSRSACSESGRSGSVLPSVAKPVPAAPDKKPQKRGRKSLVEKIREENFTLTQIFNKPSTSPKQEPIEEKYDPGIKYAISSDSLDELDLNF